MSGWSNLVIGRDRAGRPDPASLGHRYRRARDRPRRDRAPGMGYESNEASVLTNVSSDHLDLQGIHTLPELAEVKSTICLHEALGLGRAQRRRPPRPAIARRVRGHRVLLDRRPDAARRPTARPRWWPRVPRAGWDADRGRGRPNRRSSRSGGCRSDRRPRAPQRGQCPGGGGRCAGMGATLAQVRDGLMDFAPSSDRSPGRLNLFRLGSRVVIVDFAHNEAGIAAVMDVAEGIAAGGAGRTAPITVIIGTAGDLRRRCGASARSPPSGLNGSPSRRRSSTCAAGPLGQSSASCSRA